MKHRVATVVGVFKDCDVPGLGVERVARRTGWVAPLGLMFDVVETLDLMGSVTPVFCGRVATAVLVAGLMGTKEPGLMFKLGVTKTGKVIVGLTVAEVAVVKDMDATGLTDEVLAEATVCPVVGLFD